MPTPAPVPLPLRTARERALFVPELASMIVRAVGCTRSIVRMQSANKELRRYSQFFLACIFVPQLFLRTFFNKPDAALAMIKNTCSIVCGDSLREYMYSQSIRSLRLIIMTNVDRLDEVADFLLDHDYTLFENGRRNPFEGTTCAAATCYIRFRRESADGSKTYVTVQGALHNPLRLLFRTTYTYALQYCDGHRFVDLYPRLGSDGPNPQFSHGRHAHLLDSEELMRNLPPQAFDLRRAVPNYNVVCIERWIGDASTWVIPCPETDEAAPIEPSGWTIRLNTRRPHGTPYSHLWTTTHCRCLRHAFLEREYVLPQPVYRYAIRVLDKMHDVLAVGVGDILTHLDGSPIEFDAAAVQAIAAFRAGLTFSFRIDDYTIEVERDGCDY